jgi:hypothetical protein
MRLSASLGAGSPIRELWLSATFGGANPPKSTTRRDGERRQRKRDGDPKAVVPFTCVCEDYFAAAFSLLPALIFTP